VIVLVTVNTLSGYPKRMAIADGLIVSLLIVRGLAPYHWSQSIFLGTLRWVSSS
jgi:hypothetical protein